MTNLPVFFTSVAARAARLFKILEQAAAFSSCSSAIRVFALSKGKEAKEYTKPALTLQLLSS